MSTEADELQREIDGATGDGHKRLMAELASPEVERMAAQLALYPVAIKLLERLNDESLPFYLRNQIADVLRKDRSI